MKREINMRSTPSQEVPEKSRGQKENFTMISDSKIDTDPLGSWTGTPSENPFDKPVQDVDDL